MRIKVREGNLSDRPFLRKIARDRGGERERGRGSERADERKEGSEGDVPRVLETAANSARNLPKCLSVGRVTSCKR